jgi:uncharacterized membrane protein YesL
VDFPSDINIYCRLREIFRSWFWRFYDHFFLLVLINFCWALTSLGIAWIAIRSGLLEPSVQLTFLSAYVLFLFECAASIGWAFLVFKIFIGGDAKVRDIWIGIRCYFLKGMGISALWGFFILWTLLSANYYFSLRAQHPYFSFLTLGFVFWILLFSALTTLYHWPILFFQNPPFTQIIYKSVLLVFVNGFQSLVLLLLFFSIFVLFSIFWPLWFFLGVGFFFSFQCVALEKQYLRYKIVYGDKPFGLLLDTLDKERKRGWRDFLKPWEN